MKQSAAGKRKPSRKAPAEAEPVEAQRQAVPADLSAPAAEWVAISDLAPWPENPRENDEAVEPVAASIRRFGFGAPLVARKANGEIIAGHTRIRAAQAAGMTHVPVRYLDISEDEAHLLALADNRLGEKATWREDALARASEKWNSDDLAVLGWTTQDIAHWKADFAPVGPETQDSLDTTTPKHECPNCGHKF